ncbi:MAG: hypothetical protein WCW77_00520 [Patescibacteria group bacterium]|jgi:hypothetical protein
MKKDNLVLFTNWTDEDFKITFNNVPYEFKAGESEYIEAPVGKLFAKHLIDRELNKQNIPTSHPMREEMEAKCLSTPVNIPEEDEKEEKGEDTNPETAPASDEVPGEEKTDEEEFDGLKEGELDPIDPENENKEPGEEVDTPPEGTGKEPIEDGETGEEKTDEEDLGEETPKPVDYEAMTKNELIKVANEKGIETKPAMTKKEIIEALNNLATV